MKTTVIYHSADYDGLFCREIARKFLPEAELIGWNHGEPKIAMPAEGSVYVMDLSPDCLALDPLKILPSRLIWIDHHRTAIEKFGRVIVGYRIDGVAACRLAWQWFTIVDGNTRYGDVGNAIRAAGVLPDAGDFKERKVNEPLAVRLAGEYDVWDRRDPNAEIFQYGLDAQKMGGDGESLSWGTLLQVGNGAGGYVGNILNDGEAARRAIQKREAEVITTRAQTIQWRGLCFLALNTARCNSLSFKAGIRPEHDALMGYFWNGDKWTFSLYGVPGKPDVDLGAIASSFPDGGGHKQACGFQVGWKHAHEILFPF